MNEKLKPCPFCDGDCKIKAAIKEYIGFTIWCECEDFHAQTSGYCPDIRKEDTAIVNIDSCRNKAPYLVKAIEIVKAGGTDES